MLFFRKRKQKQQRFYCCCCCFVLKPIKNSPKTQPKLKQNAHTKPKQKPEEKREPLDQFLFFLKKKRRRRRSCGARTQLSSSFARQTSNNSWIFGNKNFVFTSFSFPPRLVRIGTTQHPRFHPKIQQQQLSKIKKQLPKNHKNLASYNPLCESPTSPQDVCETP